MHIVTRVRLSLGAMVALVLLAVAAGTFGLRTAGKLAGYFPEKLLPGTSLVLTADANVERYARLLGGQIIAGKSIDSLRAELDAQMKAIGDLGRNSEDPQVKEITLLLESEWQKVRQADPGKPESVAQAAEHIRRIEEAMAGVGKTVARLSKDASDKIMNGIQTLGTVLLVGGLVTAMVGGLIGWTLGRSINQPLGALQTTMNRIAETNDLTQRAESNRKDEFGAMATAFNDMVARLQELVRQVSTTTHEVHDSATGLAFTADELTASASRQTEAVAANAAAIEELSSSIATVSDTSETVSRQSASSVEKTSAGNRKLAELVAEIETIQSNVNQIAASVEEFVKSTSAITGMTQEVREIADQTNLLALNAAIEAARAGEQGRGFAVVADEVRKLAEKSGSSAGEIDSVARRIIAQSEEVRTAIKAGRQSIDASATLAVEVEATLNHAREAVEQAGMGVKEIDASVREQRVASTQIAQHMQEIANSAEDASGSASKMNDSAASLTRSAEQLKHAISGFRV